jgi:hypothetical protein
LNWATGTELAAWKKTLERAPDHAFAHYFTGQIRAAASRDSAARDHFATRCGPSQEQTRRAQPPGWILATAPDAAPPQWNGGHALRGGLRATPPDPAMLDTLAALRGSRALRGAAAYAQQAMTISALGLVRSGRGSAKAWNNIGGIVPGGIKQGSWPRSGGRMPHRTRSCLPARLPAPLYCHAPRHVTPHRAHGSGFGGGYFNLAVLAFLPM